MYRQLSRAAGSAKGGTTGAKGDAAVADLAQWKATVSEIKQLMEKEDDSGVDADSCDGSSGSPARRRAQSIPPSGAGSPYFVELRPLFLMAMLS